MSSSLDETDADDRDDGSSSLGKDAAPFERPTVERLVNKPLRKAAFRKKLLRSYNHTCSFTGLRITYGAGRAKVEAAHLRPVGDNHRGSDSIRNGIALSKTVHWMFERGILAISDSFEILRSPGRLPEQLKPLLNANSQISLPRNLADRPSPANLAYHRQMFEEEYGRFVPL